jgi:cobalt-zinc-cadmium efflux system membrane fusion protein
MRKKYISIFIILSILGLGIGCSKKTAPDSKKSQQKKQQSLDNSPGRKQRRGQQSGGRGQKRRQKGITELQEFTPVELTEEEKKAIDFETVEVTFNPLKAQLSAMGKVKAHQHRKAIVSYAFPARISEIHVRIGDWVKTGQELVTLQSEEVGNAKSDFYKSQADFELAKVNYERQKRLFDRGVGAQKDYLSAEAEYKVAEANLNAAEKKLHVLGFSEEQVKTISESHQINPIITLYSPIIGKIIANNAILGAMIDQGTEILTILDPSVLCIDADIYEKDIAKIKTGQNVEVSVPAYPGEKFIGHIKYISDVLNEDTRAITVRTEVENRDNRLKAGMFANINIILNHESKTLVLPTEAILDEKDKKIAFVEKEGKYILHFLQLGAYENGYVEILKGVQEGDVVVTKGNYQLKSKLYEEILKKGHVH